MDAMGEAVRGTVFHYDEDHDYGYIHGIDGKRYIFSRGDLTQDMSLTKGMLVEFAPDDGTAHDIVAAKSAAVPSSGDPKPAGSRATESSSVTSVGLWAYFLRALGDDYRNFTGRASRKEFWAF